MEAAQLGYFVASTAAVAALIAAAETSEPIFAVVSRGGRPDLAKEWLPEVQAPTFLIVGGADREVLRPNFEAQALMKAECEVEIVPGATRLFEEPDALENVARMAAAWFNDHLKAQNADSSEFASTDEIKRRS